MRRLLKLSFGTKSWALFSVMAVMGIVCSFPAYAYEEPDHNNFLQAALFGEQPRNNLSQKGEVNFRVLCEALFLTLDYTSQDKGVGYLEDLKKHGVKDLPVLNEITFSGNQHHQRYTHWGWDKGFSGYGAEADKAHWEKRKQLLLNTVQSIGKFNKNEKIKIDSFAGLVYEIHVLDDFIGDTESTRMDRLRLSSDVNYRGQKVSPTSDGPFNNPTLINYMIYHIQRLFREQKNSPVLTYLIGELEIYEKRFTREDYSQYETKQIPYSEVQSLARKVRGTLREWLPQLLENEPFFQRAFGL